MRKKHKKKSRKAIAAELEARLERRARRFRVLVCIDGSAESDEAVRFAARIAKGNEIDIVLTYVRPIDHGLRTGGLQVRVARQNMLNWGHELPGIKYLKRGLHLLIDEDSLETDWETKWSHSDTWNDPLGDNKIEYRHKDGQRIILKLKTAPDAAAGILDQYELGPYNLIVLGEPSRWRGEFKSVFDAGVVQKIAVLAPCSVLVARKNLQREGHLICTDGSEDSFDAVRQDAVFADYCGSPITLFSVAETNAARHMAEEIVDQAEAMLNEIGIKVAGKKTAVGDPVERIVKAGAGQSVICISDTGKTWLRRFFTGSVAFDVIRQAKTSVLNVR